MVEKNNKAKMKDLKQNLDIYQSCKLAARYLTLPTKWKHRDAVHVAQSNSTSVLTTCCIMFKHVLQLTVVIILWSLYELQKQKKQLF